MILSFSKSFPWGDPTGFVDKILSGKKIHTVRRDKSKRWKEGMKIHFATGMRTPNYNQFHEGVCTGVQEIEIRDEGDATPMVIVDGVMINKAGVIVLAIYDGFESLQDFRKFFGPEFKGRLIHWTDVRY